MKTALRPTMRARFPVPSAGTNCGRKAKKKIVSFGLRMFTRTPETSTRRAGTGAASSSTTSAPCSRNVLHAIHSR
jgi:hypothetical protein